MIGGGPRCARARDTIGKHQRHAHTHGQRSKDTCVFAGRIFYFFCFSFSMEGGGEGGWNLFLIWRFFFFQLNTRKANLLDYSEIVEKRMIFYFKYYCKCNFLNSPIDRKRTCQFWINEILKRNKILSYYSILDFVKTYNESWNYVVKGSITIWNLSLNFKIKLILQLCEESVRMNVRRERNGGWILFD